MKHRATGGIIRRDVLAVIPRGTAIPKATHARMVGASLPASGDGSVNATLFRQVGLTPDAITQAINEQMEGA